MEMCNVALHVVVSQILRILRAADKKGHSPAYRHAYYIPIFNAGLPLTAQGI